MDCYLVLGGAGFIGSNLIRYMLSQQEQLKIVVVEKPKADVSRIKDLDVEIVYCDLEQVSAIEDLIVQYHCKQVIHLISTMTPCSTYSEYLKELNCIIRPTIELLGVCSMHNVRFVFFSSGGAIYGNNYKGEPFVETNELLPISYYGLSKKVLETSIRFEHRVNGLEYLILRPSNPYGIGQSLYGKQGFIGVAIGKVLSKTPITIYGDGSSIRDYIYIDDLARVGYNLITSKDAKNEAINIGSGVGTSLNAIVGYIEDVVGKFVEVNYEEARKSDVGNVVLDVTRMTQLSLFPMTPLRDGISKVYHSIVRK